LSETTGLYSVYHQKKTPAASCSSTSESATTKTAKHSGGPVLNAQNEVIGIAVKGQRLPGKSGDDDELSRFVPIDFAREVSQDSSRRLISTGIFTVRMPGICSKMGCFSIQRRAAKWFTD